MDIRKVKKLIELLEESSLSEIEISEGEETVRLSRASQVVASPAPVQAAQTIAVSPPTEADSSEAKPSPTEAIAGTPVPSPMVGTFYRSSAPGEAPYVEEGAVVKKGDTLCIIEAMKMMNHIDAPVAGTVRKFLLQDGDPVEYGQALMYIE